MYFLSTGLCVLSIGLFVICLKRRNQFCHMLKRRQKSTIEVEKSIRVVKRESDSIYDLTDDQNMFDNQDCIGKH